MDEREPPWSRNWNRWDEERGGKESTQLRGRGAGQMEASCKVQWHGSARCCSPPVWWTRNCTQPSFGNFLSSLRRRNWPLRKASSLRVTWGFLKAHLTWKMLLTLGWLSRRWGLWSGCVWMMWVIQSLQCNLSDEFRTWHGLIREKLAKEQRNYTW